MDLLAKLHPWFVEEEVVSWLKKKYDVDLAENHAMLYVYKKGTMKKYKGDA